jgi:hypothetical protein
LARNSDLLRVHSLNGQNHAEGDSARRSGHGGFSETCLTIETDTPTGFSLVPAGQDGPWPAPELDGVWGGGS